MMLVIEHLLALPRSRQEIFQYTIIHDTRDCSHVYASNIKRIQPRLPIHTGSETDTHAHCITGRVAGRNDLSYIINNGKTHCT